jgi:hypothetical protein
MDVKSLLKELPGGNMEDQRVVFSTLDVLRGPAQWSAGIDTGTLVFA